LIGVPSIIGSIYYGGATFFLFVWVIATLGSLEYRKIVQGKDDLFSKAILIGFVSLVILGYKINFNFSQILLVIIFIMIIELFSFREKPLYFISTMIFGVSWIGMMLGSLVLLRDLPAIGFEIVTMVFVTVWCCDSFAFIAGKYFGEMKILPSISPKKTWLGTMAGILGSIITVYGFCIYGDVLGFNFIEIKRIFNFNDVLYFGLMVGVVGQLGDFFESMLKREAGIKDSSKILKGHGGILDRFDSIMFVAPSAYIYIDFILIGRL